MGKAWPIGPNDEPVGWFKALPGQEYQEAEYREDEPPATNWKPWKRARTLSWIWLAGSMWFYVTHIAWGPFWFFFASCWFWSIVFWCIFELKHREKLAKIDREFARHRLSKV